MSDVTLMLAIEASDHFGGGERWRKTIDTPFLPRAGDEIMLFGWGDSPTDGMVVPVLRPWWDANGGVYVDLQRFVINPSPDMEKLVGRADSASPLRAWRTDLDGDFIAHLEGAGWVRG